MPAPSSQVKPLSDAAGRSRFAAELHRVLPSARQYARRTEFAILLVFILVCAITDAYNPRFLHLTNVADITRTMSFLALVAIGEAVVLLAGSLDLSVGAIYGLAGIVTAQLMVHNIPVILAIVGGLAIGLAAGALNAFLVVFLRIPALITTLGTLYIFQSLSLIITGGTAVYNLPNGFITLGQGSLIGVPTPVWIALIAAAGSAYILRSTLFGRWLYAIGGNERAAFLAGLPIKRVRVETFLWSGLFAATGGILLAGRLGSAQLGVGDTTNLYAIAAGIIGGISLFGGAGTVFGCLIGTALVSVIDSALIFLGVSAFYNDLFVGAIIIIAVGTDVYRGRARSPGGNRSRLLALVTPRRGGASRPL